MHYLRIELKEQKRGRGLEPDYGNWASAKESVTHLQLNTSLYVNQKFLIILDNEFFSFLNNHKTLLFQPFFVGLGSARIFLVQKSASFHRTSKVCSDFFPVF